MVRVYCSRATPGPEGLQQDKGERGAEEGQGKGAGEGQGRGKGGGQGGAREGRRAPLTQVWFHTQSGVTHVAAGLSEPLLTSIRCPLNHSTISFSPAGHTTTDWSHPQRGLLITGAYLQRRGTELVHEASRTE